MKTMLTLLLFPIFLFSQQLEPTKHDLFETEQFIDFYVESVHVNELDIPYPLEVTIEVIVSVEIYYEELIYEPMWPEMINTDHPAVNLPKYLSAVSLENLLPKENDRFEEQLRWNRVLAINNPISSTDSVLEKLLRPAVNFEDKLAWIENRQVGFGPRVRI